MILTLINGLKKSQTGNTRTFAKFHGSVRTFWKVRVKN